MAPVSGGASAAAPGKGVPQTVHPAGVRRGSASRRVAGRSPSSARRCVCCPDQDWAGNSARQPHRRDQHQQQLLADLLLTSSDGCRIFLALGDTVLDDASVRRLLFLPLPGSRGSGTGNSYGELWPARHPDTVLLLGGDAGEPFCCRESPIDATVSGHSRDAGRNQPAVGAGTGGGAAIGATGGTGATFGRPGARDSQSSRRDQRLGGDVDAEARRLESSGHGTGRLHFNRDEPVERLGHPLSRFRASVACGSGAE